MTRPSPTRRAADADAERRIARSRIERADSSIATRLPRGREQVERIGRRRHPRGRRVEGGADVAQRQEHLGREHEHEQPGHERHVAGDQPEPDRHGDERHREARGELEREAREERDAQHLHGACAIVVGHRADAGGLPLGAAERHEGRQPADDLEEAPRQRGEALPLPPLHGLGRHADERHEHRDQRQHDHEHEARQRVGDPHRDDEHGRRDHRQHELRQVACRSTRRARRARRPSSVATRAVGKPGTPVGRDSSAASSSVRSSAFTRMAPDEPTRSHAHAARARTDAATTSTTSSGQARRHPACRR